jgi:hypothetical protein
MVTLVALTLLAVALVVVLARTRKSLLSGAIMAFARSMDITPLYARTPRRRHP